MPPRKPPKRSDFENSLGASPPPASAPDLADMPRPVSAETFASTLTEGMIQIVDRALRAGQPVSMLAGLVALRPATFERWVAEGLDEGCTDPLKARLAFVITRGRDLQGAETVELLKIQGLSDSKARLALARTQNAAWNEKTHQKVETNVTIERPEEDLSVLTDEELAQRARIEEKIASARLGKGT